MSDHRAPAPDVIGAAEVAEICGFTKSRLSQIVQDPKTTFPKHALIPSAGWRGHTMVWDRAAVRAWQQARTRDKRRGIYVVLMVHGRTGSTAKAAKSAGVHYTTARRWLKELGRL